MAPPCLLLSPCSLLGRKPAPLPCHQMASFPSQPPALWPSLCRTALQVDQDEGSLSVDPASAGTSDTTPRCHSKMTAPTSGQPWTLMLEVLFQRQGGFCAQRQMNGPFFLGPSYQLFSCLTILPWHVQFLPTAALVMRYSLGVGRGGAPCLF